MDHNLELVIDAKATLGEGPSWDAEHQRLYWVDIMEKKVHIYDTSTNTNRTIEIDQPVGAVVPRKSGGTVVALQKGFYFLDTETGSITHICDPEPHLPDNRFNDGKCDPAGRFWAGTMSTKGTKASGGLYCLDTDLKVRKVLENVTTSNGLAWSPDNKTMYYIDSPTRVVVAFDYDLETGNISNKRVVVRIPEGKSVPDGMTIDMEGMLWVAQWNGYQVSRWNPNTGELLQRIPVPAARVTSCVFGGKNLDELYITTARAGLDESALAEQPYAGGVFRIKTDTRGIPTYSFGG